MGVAPIFALSFFGNDLGKTLIRGATGSSELNAFQLGLAGGFSGILTTAIMAPGERIKCILQVRKILEFLKPEWLQYQIMVGKMSERSERVITGDLLFAFVNFRAKTWLVS